MRFLGLLILLGAGLETLANVGGSIVAPVTDPSTEKLKKPSSAQRGVIKLRIKELEKLTGRKFTLKEKLEIKILEHVYKRKLRKNKMALADPLKQANRAFIFAVAALVLLSTAFLPWAAGSIMGVIVLVAIPALAAVALWFGLRSIREGKNFKNIFSIIVGGVIILLTIGLSISALTM